MPSTGNLAGYFLGCSPKDPPFSQRTAVIPGPFLGLRDRRPKGKKIHIFSNSFVFQRATGIPALDRFEQVLICWTAYIIPVGQVAWVVGFRQIVTIGRLLPVGQSGDSGSYPVDITVETPTWHFTDGNVSWHLRAYSAASQSQVVPPPSPPDPPGTSTEYYGTQPARLILAGMEVSVNNVAELARGDF